MPIGEGISLLLVEENENALDTCYRIIRRSFPRLVVHVARTPLEAMSLFKASKHDIVMTDIVYSTGEAGIEIAGNVCSEKPDIKVIFISSSTDYNLQVLNSHPIPLCIDSVIHKPIEVQELIGKLKKAILSVYNSKGFT